METEFIPSITNRPEFIEPVFIEAGDSTLRLGQLQLPPRVNCRVVSEDLYQDMKLAYDVAPELLEALRETQKYIEFKINTTPTGQERNRVCDINILIEQALQKAL